MFGTKINKNMIKFHQLEVVDRGSEAQLQVGENSNYWIERVEGWKANPVRYGLIPI